MCKINKIKKIINISSVSAFKDATSNYGMAKFKIEKIAEKFDVINLKCGLIVSKKAKLYSKIYFFSKKLRLFPLIEKGDQKLHLLYLSDLANFIYKITPIRKKIKNKTFYVCNPNYIYFKDLIMKIDNKKIFINIPKFFIKNSLKLFSLLNIKLGFDYDNYLGLINYNKKINIKNHPFKFSFK